MNRKRTTVLLVIVFIVGLSLVLYPTLSQYWNSLHASRLIADYDRYVDKMDKTDRKKLIAEAEAYNEKITPGTTAHRLTEKEKQEYNGLLNVNGTGMIGYVEIPSISVSLPIYHGTELSVLQVAIGHLDWSSLPVGGVGTHAVLSGHRGLPASRLFTDLDDIAVGDLFIIRVLDRTLTYEVDQIKTVLPQQTDDLKVVSGMDYCTLMTCTPYGINTHRLLVRGHRVATTSDNSARIVADAVMVSKKDVAVVLTSVVLILGFLVYVIIPRRKRQKIRIEDLLPESPLNQDVEELDLEKPPGGDDKNV